MRKKSVLILSALIAILVTSCSISYSFSGTSIDYTKISTITIRDFPNQAMQVYPLLSQMMTEGIRDLYIRQTRLQQVSDNGDLEIEGEITGYELTALAVQEDAWSSETRLTITVRVRYSNRVEPEKDFERTFSAYREFSTSQMLTDVQEELSRAIVEEIADQIYNSTVADW